MPRTYSARSQAAPERAWRLMTEPARWHQWAPHVRGAIGLGSPEVEAGRAGLVRLLGVVPVPARIVDKRPGRSWTWRVGPMVLVHAVRPSPDGGGCDVSVTLQAPGPLEPLLAATYGPVISLMVRNLARVAASRSAPSS